MPAMNPEVEEFLSRSSRWRNELDKLRTILLDCDLTEEFKWRTPCYTFRKKNVAILGSLKECCTLSFFKGSLLKDPEKILEKPGENSRAARLIRVTSVREIEEVESILKAYLREAIELEESGRKVDFQKQDPAEVPEEFQARLNDDPGLRRAFQALTPGRQRGYLLHFAGAKKSSTRVARIEKFIPRILEGKGIHDCICGLSRKLPACDGSHKTLRK